MLAMLIFVRTDASNIVIDVDASDPMETIKHEIRDVFHGASSGWFTPAGNSKMEEVSLTTTSRKRAPCS